MATWTAACDAELARLAPGMTKDAFDAALRAMSEEPQDFAARGYPCLAAYVSAGSSGVGGAKTALVAIAVVGGVFWMMSSRRNSLRGLGRTPRTKNWREYRRDEW